MSRLRLSASKITTYKGCPFAYFLKYMAHEQAEEDVRLAFGKVVHSMLNKFYKNNFKSAESFAKAFKFHWFRYCSGETLQGKKKELFPVEEYQTTSGKPVKLGTNIRFYKSSPSEPKEERQKKNLGIFFGYMKIGEGIMKRFYEEYINRPDPVLREAKFELEIEGHPDKDCHRRRHRVMVIFDRVDEINSHVFISDYKTDTGDPKSKAFSIHRHPQFTLYSMTLRQLIAEKRVSFSCKAKQESAIIYHHLRSGEKLETHRSERDFDYVRHLMDDVTEGIFCNRFTPFYGFHCGLCDYQVACEKYSSDHGGPRIIDSLERKIKEAPTFNWDDDFEKFNKHLEPRPEPKPVGQLELAFGEPYIEPIRHPEPIIHKQKTFKWPKLDSSAKAKPEL